MSIGRMIVLEGIDGSGTTTQLHRLGEWLSDGGQGVHLTWEPTDGLIGSQIRSLLRGTTGPVEPNVMALLFAADRLDHLALEVEPRLKAGMHVLCDRYVGSSLAYQGMASDIDWVRQINSRARTPDLTIYLDVRPGVAMERIQARAGERRELFEKRDLLEKVSAAYNSLYCVGGTAPRGVVVVDGEASPDDVFSVCKTALERLLSTPAA